MARKNTNPAEADIATEVVRGRAPEDERPTQVENAPQPPAPAPETEVAPVQADLPPPADEEPTRRGAASGSRRRRHSPAGPDSRWPLRAALPRADSSVDDATVRAATGGQWFLWVVGAILVVAIAGLLSVSVPKIRQAFAGETPVVISAATLPAVDERLGEVEHGLEETRGLAADLVTEIEGQAAKVAGIRKDVDELKGAATPRGAVCTLPDCGRPTYSSCVKYQLEHRNEAHVRLLGGEEPHRAKVEARCKAKYLPGS